MTIVPRSQLPQRGNLGNLPVCLVSVADSGEGSAIGRGIRRRIPRVGLMQVDRQLNKAGRDTRPTSLGGRHRAVEAVETHETRHSHHIHQSNHFHRVAVCAWLWHSPARSPRPLDEDQQAASRRRAIRSECGRPPMLSVAGDETWQARQPARFAGPATLIGWLSALGFGVRRRVPHAPMMKIDRLRAETGRDARCSTAPRCSQHHPESATTMGESG